MFNLPYVEPVFRPPSEAHSLILQVAIGCSHNECSFCSMYVNKKFRPAKIESLEQQLQAVAKTGYPVRRVFLADGDAMCLSPRRLNDILDLINQYLPSVERISSYCLPANLKNKSVEDLRQLREKKLTLMYVGCESGDDEVLALVEKGETYQSSLDALTKIKQAGMQSSVMILNGLGGTKYSKQHAINSAKLMNDAQPEYLSTLVVSFPMGTERFEKNFNGDFVQLNQPQLFEEMKWLLDSLELENTVFRSDHASNYLVLKGTLGADKARLVKQVDDALAGRVALRQEWQRGL
jgi:radical SAM superfamily enzyme YgiQ (UPF0313 family)